MKSMDRVTRARSQLVTSAPFFGVLALHLEIRETAEFDTMATNGRQLFVNPAFVETLNDAELRGVLAHEVYHNAAGHSARQGGRDHDEFNKAADYAINQELKSMGFTLPDGALIDPRYSGMTAEAIYSELQRKASKQGKQGSPSQSGQSGQSGQGKPLPAASNGQKSGNGAPSSDPGKCGSVIPAPAGETAAAIAQDWQGKALVAAAIAAKQSGSIPAGIARLVSEIKSPAVDWRAMLRRFITESNSKDYSWSRPNRRHIGNGLYLPSLISDGRCRIIVAIDNSGSIDNAALAAFAAELQSVLDDGAADSVSVIYCDAAINGTAEFAAGDILKLETLGGGGTRFSPVMQWAMDNGHGAACLIYFTDLECSDFGNDPGMPVIWANWSRPRPVPFGDVIQIDGHS